MSNPIFWSNVGIDIQTALAAAITITNITKTATGVCTYSGAINPTTGDYIVLSSAPGVGRAVGSCESYPANKIVGYACEGDNRTDLRLVKVRVGGV